MGNNFSRQQRRAEERSGSKSRRWIPITTWSLIGAGIIGLGWWMAQPTKSDGMVALASSSDLSLCVSHGGLSLHIHPHLRIIIDGEEQAVPANMGVTPNCLRPMHTHDGTGIIHIESPRIRNFTVEQLFGIWGKEFSDTQFMDTKLDGDRQLKVFVDQVEVTTGRQTIMKDKTSYVIMIGKTGDTLTPPENYTFTSL